RDRSVAGIGARRVEVGDVLAVPVPHHDAAGSGHDDVLFVRHGDPVDGPGLGDLTVLELLAVEQHGRAVVASQRGRLRVGPRTGDGAVERTRLGDLRPVVVLVVAVVDRPHTTVDHAGAVAGGKIGEPAVGDRAARGRSAVELGNVPGQQVEHADLPAVGVG